MTLSAEEIAALELETEALRKTHTYENDLLTLRKTPSDALYEQYLFDLNEMTHAGGLVTKTEAEQVEGRRTWTDVVSETYVANEAYNQKHGVRGQVIKRLKDLGAANPEALYEDCLDFVRDESVLTVTFGGFGGDLHFLKQGLSDFQLLNMYERKSVLNGRRSTYQMRRNDCEVAFAAGLSKPLRKRFVTNLHARPRYGAVKFIHKSILPTRGYGSSFVVLKDVVKLNALFVPGDSLNYYSSRKRNYQMCTIHHLEFLLLQCPLEVLRAIVTQVDSNTPSSLNAGPYIEVMLPAINLFDPNLVEHIYIDADAYRVSKEDIDAITSLGIGVTNIAQTKHDATLKGEGTRRMIRAAIKAAQFDELQTLLKKDLLYVASHAAQLMRLAVKQGSLSLLNDLIETHHISPKIDCSLLHMACQQGSLEIVDVLLTHGLDINQRDRLEETPLMCAVRHGKKEVMERLLGSNVDLNLRNARNENVMDIAFKRHPDLLEPLISHALDEESLILERLSSSQIRKIYSQCVKQGASASIIALFLFQLSQKINHLRTKPNYVQALSAAENCYRELKESLQTYQRSDKTAEAELALMQTCATSIMAARDSALAHQRGFKKIVVNLALFILLAGFGHLTVAAVNYVRYGDKHVFFKAKTESIKLVDSLEKNLHKIVRPLPGKSS